MMKRSKIIGCGSYLPERVVTNAELSAKLDTTDEWITTRTGIRQRHLAADGELTSDLALKAAERALENANIPASEVDMVVLATTTPDNTFPATATKVQDKLGMVNGAAFDIQAVCSGFIYGMAIADNFIKTSQCKTVVLIGAETFSRILDWEDRSTCVLFGDGAGALVLEAQEGDGTPEDRGILATDLNSDGRHKDILYVDGGISTQTTGFLRMQGKEVFRHAVEKLAATAVKAMDSAGVSSEDVDWVVPHQANIRIIQGTARKMSLPTDKADGTVQDHGNTSAASIPLALSVGVERGQIKKGDLIVTEAIGGGLAWGAVVLRW